MPLISAQAMCSANSKGNDVLLLGCLQGALERMGLDASAAVARARSRSQSRVGRKRARSAAALAGASAAMDVDGEPAKKRVHSSKSRCAIPIYQCHGQTMWAVGRDVLPIGHTALRHIWERST